MTKLLLIILLLPSLAFGQAVKIFDHLSEQLDVTFSTLASDNYLKYNGTKWINAVPSWQPLDSDLTSWAGVTRATGFDTFTATPSMANFKSLLSDETVVVGNLLALTSPSAISFIKIAADNTVSTRTPSEVLGDIGAQAADSDLTTWAGITPGTGVGTALAVNVGSAGAFVTNNAANTFTAAEINSTSGAASTPALKLSGVPFSGTGTTSFPLLYINDANASASTTLNTAGTYLGVNGDGTQDLMNLLKDGTSQFKVSSTGVASMTSPDITTSITTPSASFSIANATATTLNIGAAATTISIGSSSATQLATNALKMAGAIIFQLSGSDTYINAYSSGPLHLRDNVSVDILTLTKGTSVTVANALVTTPQALSGAGAANVTTSATALTTAGTGDAISLANGANGQIKVIVLDVLTAGGHTSVLTPSTKTGFSTVTFTAAGQSVMLQYFTTRGWMVIGSYGTTIAP